MMPVHSPIFASHLRPATFADHRLPAIISHLPSSVPARSEVSLASEFSVTSATERVIFADHRRPGILSYLPSALPTRSEVSLSSEFSLTSETEATALQTGSATQLESEGLKLSSSAGVSIATQSSLSVSFQWSVSVVQLRRAQPKMLQDSAIDVLSVDKKPDEPSAGAAHVKKRFVLGSPKQWLAALVLALALGKAFFSHDPSYLTKLEAGRVALDFAQKLISFVQKLNL